MKNVKKLLALLLALAMLFALCACDNGKKEDEKEGQENAESNDDRTKENAMIGSELEGIWSYEDNLMRFDADGGGAILYSYGFEKELEWAVDGDELRVLVHSDDLEEEVCRYAVDGDTLRIFFSDGEGVEWKRHSGNFENAWDRLEIPAEIVGTWSGENGDMYFCGDGTCRFVSSDDRENYEMSLRWGIDAEVLHFANENGDVFMCEWTIREDGTLQIRFPDESGLILTKQ